MGGSNFRFAIVVALLVSCVAACGGASSGVAAPTVEGNPSGEAQASPADPEDAMQIEGLLGDIPREEVERVVQRKNDAIAACYQRALDVLEQIEGEVELVLEVAADGAVSQAYLRNGSLGSADAQACIVELAERLIFPRPRGGARASIVYPLILEEPYGHPAPSDWSGGKAREVADANAAAVEGCLAGAEGVQLTVYVGRGGAVVSAGATADAPEAAGAADCLAEAARTWVFPDPGGATAKAILEF